MIPSWNARMLSYGSHFLPTFVLGELFEVCGLAPVSSVYEKELNYTSWRKGDIDKQIMLLKLIPFKATIIYFGERGGLVSRFPVCGLICSTFVTSGPQCLQNSRSRTWSDIHIINVLNGALLVTCLIIHENVGSVTCGCWTVSGYKSSRFPFLCNFVCLSNSGCLINEAIASLPRFTGSFCDFRLNEALTPHSTPQFWGKRLTRLTATFYRSLITPN